MSDKTQIEWTDATWNPVTGCSKVSQGCKHCYAERDWARLAANPATRYHGRPFTDVRCHEDVLDLPMRWKKPRKVFVNSMSDLFHPDVPDAFIADVFRTMAWAHRHHFQVLTKRPERMRKLLSNTEFQASITDNAGECADWPWPLENVWLGVSVEDQATADERIPILLNTPAAVRWISAEPLLGPIDLHAIEFAETCASECCGNRRYDVLSGFTYCGHAPAEDAEPMTRLDWVVVGGESGPHARPMHPDWVRSLRKQCADDDVPFLFKQWGEWAPAEAIDEADERKLAEVWLTRFGRILDPAEGVDIFKGDDVVYRAGKKAAGRLLEGVEHNGYPVAKP